jgi:hypothetical protein
MVMTVVLEWNIDDWCQSGMVMNVVPEWNSDDYGARVEY